MTSLEARHGFPVHVRAVVTYYDSNPYHPDLPVIMVTDQTASIWVSPLTWVNPPPIKPGTVLEITGKSGPGEFAPVIIQASLQILRQGPLPERAPRATLKELLKGSNDPAWVEMEGVVEGVEIQGSNRILKLGLSDGEMGATTVSEKGVEYAGLIDALVRIRGVAASIFNRHGQMTGDQLLFPGINAVTVEQAAPPDPFQLPIREIGSLMSYSPGKTFNHRTHIRGAVTLF